MVREVVHACRHMSALHGMKVALEVCFHGYVCVYYWLKHGIGM